MYTHLPVQPTADSSVGSDDTTECTMKSIIRLTVSTVGFFGAMTKMMAASNCPIVLTCSSLHGLHQELTKIHGVEQLELGRPDTSEILLHTKATRLHSGTVYSIRSF